MIEINETTIFLGLTDKQIKALEESSDFHLSLHLDSIFNQNNVECTGDESIAIATRLRKKGFEDDITIDVLTEYLAVIRQAAIFRNAANALRTLALKRKHSLYAHSYNVSADYLDQHADDL